MSTAIASFGENLPSSLIDVAEEFGINVAIQLMQHFGGLEIKFPTVPKDDSDFVKLLGKETAIALCKYLDGVEFYVPHGRGRASVRRNVVALQEVGHTRREIARILGVSQRHVRRMANRSEDPDQFTLF